jgi:Fe-S-cluster containining protein
LAIDRKLLKFHCTGCGNCCREPLLPITDRDLRRLVEYTRQRPADLVRWVAAKNIDLDDEPEAFVRLRAGMRVMTLRHHRSGCVLLDANQLCTAYAVRPIGCRVFPFDSSYDSKGRIRRLELIQATDCPYEPTGKQSIPTLRRQQLEFLDEVDAYQAKVAAFNHLQDCRTRKRRSLLTGRDFFGFLGLS